MKIKTLFLMLLMMLPFLVNAQTRNFQQDVMYYLSINGTEQQYNGAYDEMFNLFKKQFAKAQVPDAIWQELKTTQKAGAMYGIKSLLTSAYRKHFTHTNIKEMIRFYETDVAKRLIEDPKKLIEEDRKIVGKFYQSAVGQKINETRAALADDISQLSVIWSGDLYKSTLTQLNEKGYRQQR